MDADGPTVCLWIAARGAAVDQLKIYHKWYEKAKQVKLG
jgi:hypothetical protein